MVDMAKSQRKDQPRGAEDSSHRSIKMAPAIINALMRPLHTGGETCHDENSEDVVRNLQN